MSQELCITLISVITFQVTRTGEGRNPLCHCVPTLRRRGNPRYRHPHEIAALTAGARNDGKGSKDCHHHFGWHGSGRVTLTLGGHASQWREGNQRVPRRGVSSFLSLRVDPTPKGGIRFVIAGRPSGGVAIPGIATLMRLPRSLRELAMTKRELRHGLFAGMTMLFVL